jgi:hypothetical protein
MIDEEFRRGIDRLQKAGYLGQISKMAMASAAPFWWSSKGEGEKPVIRGNGTVCYVNTGQRRLGITADHVVAQWRKRSRRALVHLTPQCLSIEAARAKAMDVRGSDC